MTLETRKQHWENLNPRTQIYYKRGIEGFHSEAHQRILTNPEDPANYTRFCNATYWTDREEFERKILSGLQELIRLHEESDEGIFRKIGELWEEGQVLKDKGRASEGYKREEAFRGSQERCEIKDAYVFWRCQNEAARNLGEGYADLAAAAVRTMGSETIPEIPLEDFEKTKRLFQEVYRAYEKLIENCKDSPVYPEFEGKEDNTLMDAIGDAGNIIQFAGPNISGVVDMYLEDLRSETK